MRRLGPKSPLMPKISSRRCRWSVLRRVPVDELIKQAKEPSGGWIFDETAAAGAALSADPRYSKELDAYLVAMASQEPEASKIWLHSNSSVLPEAIVAWEEPYVKKANSILVSGNPKNGVEVSFDGIFKGKDLQVEHDTPFVAMRWKDNQRLDRDGIGFILGTNKTIKHREFNHGKTEDVYLDLNLDTKFATNLRTTYSPLSTLSQSATDEQKITAIEKSLVLASLDPNVAASLLQRAGQTKIGVPIVFSARDKDISAPTLNMQKYDVFGLQLAINPDEDLIRAAKELRYEVSLINSDCFAMALYPLRVAKEIGNPYELPSVRLGSKRFDDQLSETAEFSYVRPVIMANGLQLAKFYWQFSGDALDASAKTVFAVVAVPKGTKELFTRMDISVKVPSWASFDWAATVPMEYTIDLW